MLFRREGDCFRCERTPETRKRIVEHSFHKILHNVILWLLHACFKLPCVDNNGLTKVAQFIFTKTIKYHFNESRNPIYHSKCVCERTFHKDSGRNFQTNNKEWKTWAKQSGTCLVTSRAFVIVE